MSAVAVMAAPGTLVGLLGRHGPRSRREAAIRPREASQLAAAIETAAAIAQATDRRTVNLGHGQDYDSGTLSTWVEGTVPDADERYNAPPGTVLLSLTYRRPRKRFRLVIEPDEARRLALAVRAAVRVAQANRGGPFRHETEAPDVADYRRATGPDPGDG
jgi:hypothetical protein